MNLLKTASKGIAWTTISTLTRSVVQLLQVAILTRYLDKSDFGIVAIATLFLGFTQLFLDMGISAGILHKQDTTSKQYSTLFWLNIITGTFLTLSICCISPIIADFYSEPKLIPIISILSFNIFFSALGSQHRTVQQKKLRFKYLSIIEIISSILTLILAVILVNLDFGIYSLIYSSLFHSASSNITYLIIGLYKDRNISFHFKFSESFPFLKIGVYTIGSQILDYFSRELDLIIISSTLSKESLGIYSLCKKIVLAIFSSINPIITKVLTPILATMQNELVKIRNAYYNIVESLALINYPIYILIAIFSFGILNYIYGNQYVEGNNVLAILALTYGLNTTGNPVGSLQIATGRTDSGFYWTIVRIIVNTIGIYIGAQYGINGLALGMLITTILINPIFWKITIYPLIGGKYTYYFKITILPMILLLLISLPLYIFCNKYTNVLLCLSIGAIYIIFYCFIIYKLYPNNYLSEIVAKQILTVTNKIIKK